MDKASSDRSESELITSYVFWHNRLGHPDDETLVRAVENIVIPKNKPICDSCVAMYGEAGPPGFDSEDEIPYECEENTPPPLDTLPDVVKHLAMHIPDYNVYRDTLSIQWFVEREESDHICCNEDFVVEKRWLKKPRYYDCGDEELRVKYECTVELPVLLNGKTVKVRLEKVLFIPDMGCNVVSVRQLNKNGYSTAFAPSGTSYVIDRRNQKIFFRFGLKKGENCVDLAPPYQIPYDEVEANPLGDAGEEKLIRTALTLAAMSIDERPEQLVVL